MLVVVPLGDNSIYRIKNYHLDKTHGIYEPIEKKDITCLGELERITIDIQDSEEINESFNSYYLKNEPCEIREEINDIIKYYIGVEDFFDHMIDSGDKRRGHKYEKRLK